MIIKKKFSLFRDGAFLFADRTEVSSLAKRLRRTFEIIYIDLFNPYYFRDIGKIIAVCQLL